MVKGSAFELPIDITSDCKMSFLRYFEKIGLNKGLVFKEATRKRLREEQRLRKIDFVIEWAEKHYWRKNEEV